MVGCRGYVAPMLRAVTEELCNSRVLDSTKHQRKPVQPVPPNDTNSVHGVKGPNGRVPELGIHSPGQGPT